MNAPADGSRLTGQRVGPYLIEELIGAGGMGQVYRARDTRLDRDVAIKVLPDEFARDPDRATRFEREATILASLNHPNIAHIHGIEETDGVLALVMEYVRGDTLVGRRLTMEEALKVARQIAAALEAAHEKGIIHRDLKPANVMVTPNGLVKVLDFGLAKLGSHETGTVRGSALTNSPTMLTHGRTREGVLLGTGAYMSPEQARGQVVDARTDIWAFGCVLYEMLTGRAVFAGQTLSDTIAAVLEREPDWQRLPAATPDSVRRLLRRCLQKDPNRRLADIRDARWDLEETPADLATGAEPSSRARRLERYAWAAALLVAVIVAAVMTGRPSERAAPRDPRQVRFQIPSPPTRDPGSVAISPDARQIVFAATADERTKLWVHSLDTASARPLMGTDGGRMPFWSPDSRAIGFFAEGRLKRIDLDSGTVLPLAAASNPYGGTWTDDGRILFVPVGGSPVLQMSSRGGDTTAIESTALVGVAEFPRSLPGTGRVLFSARGRSAGLYVGARDGPERQRLGDRAFATAAGDSLLFIRDRGLFVQRLDPSTLELGGTPTQVATGVTGVSIANDGSLVYRSGPESGSQLSWFDRSGTEVGRASNPGLVPSISHDGRRVTMTREATGPGSVNGGIWIWDIERDRFSRLVAAPPVGNTPIWSFDDTRIVYSSPRGKPFALYEKPAEGGGTERLVLQTDQAIFANDWSRNGVLIYRSSDPKMGMDLWTLSVKDDRREPLLKTDFNEREAQFSPDGRWFAYQSDQTGQYEIYIRPFPDDGRKGYGPLSVNGGTQVRWNSNGKELFYVSSDERLMTVPISTTANGQTIEAGKPVALFQTHIVETGVLGQQYVVSRDGKRFLILSTQEAISPITVILNSK
jgi:eukaryotic-like serine/threonine-protein kinase